MPSGRNNLPTKWLAGATACAALLSACGEPGDSHVTDAAPGHGVYIGSSWESSRQQPGHDVHVVREKIACAKCHDIGQTSFGGVTPERCTPCHQKEARIEHAVDQARQRFGSHAKADCTTCHAFSRGDGGTHLAGACSRCHLEAQGDTPAVRVHAEAECVQCHKPHEDAKPVSAPCTNCHAAVESDHGPAGAPAGACTTCHQHQHAPAADARPTCAECHAKQKPTVPASALFAEGHTECVGCHQPHGFDPAKAVACRSCHEDVLVLGAPRVRQHAQCTSCHAAHDVKGSADRACASCHRDKHPDHPKHGVAGTCVGCHDPHPSSQRQHTRAKNCSSCHQSAASDSHFHGGTACTQCHAPHDFVRPPSDRSACRACHERQLGLVATEAGHQKCEGCHGGLPHRPATLATGCASCHQQQHGQVAKGHANCTSCHEPHSGSRAAECRSCHATEHTSAPAGHKNCTSCHQPHSGSTSKATCASCHAAEAKTEHGKIAQGCGSCHRAHGPTGPAKPPACASCHKSSSLSGLHQVAKHQQCARCHTGHGEPAPNAARDACLACHTDRKDHFPEAPRCASCHLFTKTR